MEIQPSTNDQTYKKGRHRKKQLYTSIRDLMEFYFSDSNLSKDRFLSNLMRESQYVDLTVFLQFNKIRKLNATVDDISKALRKSELLELSEDVQSVKRKIPVQEKGNVEACTIYVENLKSDATHEWLTSLFQEFGKVTYVSIPKYKNKEIIKGFAFVEFQNEEEAEAALNYFESIDCKIPLERDPSLLCSITTFENSKLFTGTIKVEPKDEPDKENGNKLNPPEKPEISSDAQDLESNQVDPNIDETSKKIGKKRKLSSESQESENCKKSKIVESNEEAVTIKQENPDLETEHSKKKHKKHKNKAAIKEIGLRILSKKDWKRMRNRYLDMQRNNMKKLKQHLYKQKFAPNYGHKPVVKSEIDNADESDVKPFIKKEKTVDYTPATIVKLTLFEPCLDGKKLKKEIKEQSPEIKYVDIPPVGNEVFIRFSEAQHAQVFCKTDFKGKSVVLEDEEEQRYWEKIRENLSFKDKKNKQRGRDKLLKKAEKLATHVRFEED